MYRKYFCLRENFLLISFFSLPADRAHLGGASKDAGAVLVSLIGITNTIGRVLCGWLSDHPKIDALVVNNVALTIGGLATVLSTLSENYYALVVYSCVFGFAIGK